MSSIKTQSNPSRLILALMASALTLSGGQADAADVAVTIGVQSGQISAGDTITISGNAGATDITTTGNIGTETLAVTTNATVGGTLGVTGATTMSTLSTSGAATLNSAAVTNNATVGGTLGVTGATTMTGALTANGGATVTGATGINISGNAATTIGSTSGTGDVNIASADTVNVRVGAAGAASSGAMSLSGTQSALTYTNSAGNTHGLTVGESSTTLSGGTTSTTLTLNNNGASFADHTNAPVTVTGVADGVNDFDAVNRRQLNKAFAGIAGAYALAAMPAPAYGKQHSFGMGAGYYEGENAIAMGYKGMIDKDVMLTVGASYNSQKVSGANVGVGWSW